MRYLRYLYRQDNAIAINFSCKFRINSDESEIVNTDAIV